MDETESQGPLGREAPEHTGFPKSTERPKTQAHPLPRTQSEDILLGQVKAGATAVAVGQSGFGVTATLESRKSKHIFFKKDQLASQVSEPSSSIYRQAF